MLREAEQQTQVPYILVTYITVSLNQTIMKTTISGLCILWENKSLCLSQNQFSFSVTYSWRHPESIFYFKIYV